MANRKRICLLLLILFLLTAVGACKQPDNAADRVKLLKIFDDVLTHYATAEFNEIMSNEKNSLKALKYALKVQEDIAANYGWDFFQYMDAIKRLKHNPRVDTKLMLVKEKMRDHYKLKLDMDKMSFSNAD